MNRVLLLAVVLAAIAAACSSPGDANSQITTTSSSMPTTTVATTTIPTTTTSPSTTTTTAATTTTTAAEAIAPGEDADVDAITLAYQVVFSSKTGFDEKVPYLVDPDGLEGTVAKYQETGESMGGVELAPTAIVIDGATATVTYDLLFGGTPTYPDLTGDSVLVDGTWKITRDMFCSLMASARVGCPEE